MRDSGRQPASAFRRALVLVALVVASAAPAFAGVSLTGSGKSGSGGYRETGLDLKVQWPWVLPTNKADQDGPVTAGWVSVGTTKFQLDNVPDSRERRLGGGLEFIRHIRVSVTGWEQPEVSTAPGAYRGSGFRSDVRLYGPGFIPNLVADDDPLSMLESELDFNFDQTGHESRTTGTILRPSRWASLQERRFAGRLTETFIQLTPLGDTSVDAFAESHSYDQNLDRLNQLVNLPLLRLRTAAGSLALVEGFVKRLWGVGATQDVTKWVTLGGEWSRTDYELSQPRSEHLTGDLTVNINRYFSVTATSERVRRKGESDLNYSGISANARF